MTDLEQLILKATQEIQTSSDLKSLDQYRVHYLGKKGKLTEYLKTLGQLPATERPVFGQKVNIAKQKIHELIEQQTLLLQQHQIAQEIAAETIDITLPGRRQSLGSIHPVTKTQARIEDLFSQMGFIKMDGPEIETEYYNFEALNIPSLHPARAMQDTFYFEDNTLLRSHVSPVQIHAMQTLPPPLRIMTLGRVYRRDFDLTHTPMFHQIECLMVDEKVSFADLKGILIDFLQAFFEKSILIRFRASYFPFTEPSAEVDIGCLNCSGQGCRLCKNTGWLEVLGCGMVHPNVLRFVNIDSERYTGWALGCGLDRLALLRYGIPDLRAMFENDLRFLKQF